VDLRLMKIAIIGAGGHAKVVADAILAAGGYQLIGFFDDDPLRVGEYLGHPVLGRIETWQRHAIDSFIIGIGDNLMRKRHFEALDSAGAKLATIVHPRAVIARGVTLGAGTVALANAVVNCDTRIGANGILNTACTVDHDCTIGPHAHLAPGVNLAGEVRFGAGVFAGIGAKIIPRISVGDWALIGAGAVVIRDVAAGARVAGLPARDL
jgi:sugar O-acyltransferase (sialic acid O-acetyltransferase NeuD family)